MNHLNKKQKIILGILISIIGITIYCYTDASYDLNQNEIENTLEIPEQNKIGELETSEPNQTNKIETIFVHIAGCVKKEGILELKSNSRIADAIEAAGGLNQDADLSNINLAYILEDGMKIYIPNKNEKQENTLPKNDENVNTQENTNKENKIQKVNINTATQTELETLPGIGPSTALKILAYRKEKGKFTNKEQIKEVSGIGEAKYEKIREHITVK